MATTATADPTTAATATAAATTATTIPKFLFAAAAGCAGETVKQLAHV